jgi:predicted transcriptional regulator/transcriptional regulator with XRE-family HTH domain
VHAPIGIRISTRRRALAVSQAELARLAGISPSYLNLIEANKRQVGGALLQRIAGALKLDIGELTGEAEHRLIHELVEAFADPALAGSGMGAEQARQLVATSPQVAQVIARLYRAYVAAMSNTEAYADRLRADPLLSQLLHQVLSGITAIRSGAEILETVSDLSPDERQRFVGSINRETLGLSAVARNLIGQFDQTSSRSSFVSARQEVDDMIFAAQNHFPALETRAAELRSRIEAEGPFGEAAMMAVLAADHGIGVQRSAEGRDGKAFGYEAGDRMLWFRNTAPQSTRQFQLARLIAELDSAAAPADGAETAGLTSEMARRGARRYLGAYVAGAILFPYEAFLADAQALRYDVDGLSERYTASFEQIAHRLVTLRRPGASGVPFGFLRADPAGRLSKHFPLPGLLLPNSGHACPLWAIYSAFRMPGQLVRQVTQFSDGSRFLFVAKAVARRSSGFADPAPPHSVLLVTDILHADETVYGDGLNLADRRFDVPVGPTCRLCTRPDCASRQEQPWSPGGEEAPPTLVGR